MYVCVPAQIYMHVWSTTTAAIVVDVFRAAQSTWYISLWTGFVWGWLVDVYYMYTRR